MNIYEFWRTVIRKDAEGIRGFFREDARIKWHCTNEYFTLEEFLRANCEYPGEWGGEVERVETMGDLIITAVRVYSRDGSVSCHAVSFIRLQEGKIADMDEYWGDDGPIPQWRQDKHLGKSIKE